jgi:hypothetical protein
MKPEEEHSCADIGSTPHPQALPVTGAAARTNQNAENEQNENRNRWHAAAPPSLAGGPRFPAVRCSPKMRFPRNSNFLAVTQTSKQTNEHEYTHIRHLIYGRHPSGRTIG